MKIDDSFKKLLPDLFGDDGDEEISLKLYPKWIYSLYNKTIVPKENHLALQAPMYELFEKAKEFINESSIIVSAYPTTREVRLHIMWDENVYKAIDMLWTGGGVVRLETPDFYQNTREHLSPESLDDSKLIFEIKRPQMKNEPNCYLNPIAFILKCLIVEPGTRIELHFSLLLDRTGQLL